MKFLGKRPDPRATRADRTPYRILRRKFSAFTLVELIVVITILAILATIGFLVLSGYSQDAKESAIKANIRSVYSAIVSEAAITWNSPRYYVVHDPAYSLTGGAVVVFDGTPTVLTGGDWDASGTNYSVGNPDYAKLRMNKEKFKLAFHGSASGFPVPAFLETSAAASANPGYLLVGAVSTTGIDNGKPRTRSHIQVAGTPTSSASVVVGDYSAQSGSVAGLIRDLANPSSSGAITDGTKAWTVSPQPSNCSIGQYSATGVPPCTTAAAGYWASPNNGSTGNTAQTVCSAWNYCVSWVSYACPGGTSSPAGSTTSSACVARGDQSYATPGTYSWTAPAGVTKVSVVCVWGGGGNYDASTLSNINHGAGGGGGLGYKNNVTVVPWNSYTVQVGVKWGHVSRVWQPWWDSYFSGSTFVKGIGGGGGTTSAGGTWGWFVGDGWGNGGSGYYKTSSSSWHGGGGAGWYSGNWGNGGISSSLPTSGAGGGGGGGNYLQGGGVGLNGQGANGAAGDTATYVGKWWSGWEDGSNDNSASWDFWAGGGGNSGDGGSGWCRIVWPWNTRSFPSTDVGP